MNKEPLQNWQPVQLNPSQSNNLLQKSDQFCEWEWDKRKVQLTPLVLEVQDKRKHWVNRPRIPQEK